MYGENRVLEMLKAQKMYYDVIEQSKYHIEVKMIDNLEDVSDVFYTHEEICTLTGESYISKHQRVIYFDDLIKKELENWSGQLEESGKKTIVIKDHELVETLKNSARSLADFAGHKYMRRGDRIGYYIKRKKTKATKGDLRTMWTHLEGAYHDKYTCWLPHIPGWVRTLTLFESLQDIVGYRRVRARMHEDDVKFLRQIWYNPKEYF